MTVGTTFIMQDHDDDDKSDFNRPSIQIGKLTFMHALAIQHCCQTLYRYVQYTMIVVVATVEFLDQHSSRLATVELHK